MQLILRDTRTLLFGRWACLSIGFMLFVVEWHYNQGQQEDMYVISIVLSYPTLLLSPFLCLYAAYFNLHNQSVRVSHWISSVLAASGMAA